MIRLHPHTEKLHPIRPARLFSLHPLKGPWERTEGHQAKNTEGIYLQEIRMTNQPALHLFRPGPRRQVHRQQPDPRMALGQLLQALLNLLRMKRLGGWKHAPRDVTAIIIWENGIWKGDQNVIPGCRLLAEEGDQLPHGRTLCILRQRIVMPEALSKTDSEHPPRDYLEP
jgi:hypothetical protein